MKFIKKSRRKRPLVSLVLLDWSVRESFHLFHYLEKQVVDREDFEVIVIEYYSRVSEALRKFEDQVDTWITLEIPETCYYHKHLMYNVGIVVANGSILMIGDSDAMVKETFISTIAKRFREDPNIVFHIDQFRNGRRDFYPFNYPTFEQVLGDGCINNVNGKTAGILNNEDPIHSRNYGSCMCALRSDLIAIGGADMHLDYLGHICGPYEMTFRLVNFGRREVWDMDEFMFHTWHPGQAGADNYLGPHDGRHMSSAALEAITSHRILPLEENEAIRLLRTGEASLPEDVIDLLIDPRDFTRWDRETLAQGRTHQVWNDHERVLGLYKGYRMVAEVGRVRAEPVGAEPATPVLHGLDFEDAMARVDAETPRGVSLLSALARHCSVWARAANAVDRRLARRAPWLPRLARKVFGLAAALPIVGLASLLGPERLRQRLGLVHADLGNPAARMGNLACVALRAPAIEGRRLCAIVDCWSDATFLRAAGALRWIPPMDAHPVRDAEDVERTLKEFEARREHDLLLVPADVYTRFQPILQASAPDGLTIV